MPNYMFLLHESPDAFTGLSAEEIQAIIQRYSDWRRRLEHDGRYVGGKKLRSEGGRVLRRRGSQVVATDGPYVEAREVLGGYFVIRADSYDHAVELAHGSPHLERGTLEIREIEFE